MLHLKQKRTPEAPSFLRSNQHQILKYLLLVALDLLKQFSWDSQKDTHNMSSKRHNVYSEIIVLWEGFGNDSNNVMGSNCFLF